MKDKQRKLPKLEKSDFIGLKSLKNRHNFLLKYIVGKQEM
jgi:hypothetical protein